VIKRYRILPYSELLDILREDGEAFFENSPEQPLRRSTIWRAARRLSEMLGRKVVASSALVRKENGESMEGYLFSVERQRSRRRKETSS
jgi:hypothetical protein